MATGNNDTCVGGTEGEPYKDLFATDTFDGIVNLTEESLTHAVSYRKDATQEAKNMCRELNLHGRREYAEFIRRVGRNVYPVIIASDHEPEFSGVGSTFTLYLEDGTVEKMTPALKTNYEVYKSVAHSLLAVTVLITPYLSNPTATAWHQPIAQYLAKVDDTISAIQASTDSHLNKELIKSMLSDVSFFLRSCLDQKYIDVGKYRELNEKNSARAKETMHLATKEQAEANVEALLKWKEKLGPSLWHEVYVVIPTVWPVSSQNPRLELFRNLLDQDQVVTHIFLSEHPRNADECRTLVGRNVGDRALGRFVFGTESHFNRMKTVALSTQVDAVTDDAIPNIQNALKAQGCVPRPYLASKSTTSSSCPFKQ